MSTTTRFAPATRHTKAYHQELKAISIKAQQDDLRFVIGPLACAVLEGCYTCVHLQLDLGESPTEALEELNHEYNSRTYHTFNPGQKYCYDHLTSLVAKQIK